MTYKLKVPIYAKKSANEALIKRVGLSDSKKLGIESGVTRARQIINKDYYDWRNPDDRNDLIEMSNFYNRFKNCYSPKCDGSMGLWGGRWFLRNDLKPFVKRMRKIDSKKL